MHSKKLNSDPTIYVLIFETGDRFPEELVKFAQEAGLTASRFTAIGAFETVKLGYFDLSSKDYLPIKVDEQAEVLSLLGDIVMNEGKQQIHAHAVLGLRDGTTRGGHVLDAQVRPTLELIIDETPAHLRKRHDPATGLALIDIE